MIKTITEKRIEGNIDVDGDLKFENGCYVTGSIKTTGFIDSYGPLTDGGAVKAGITQSRVN